MEKDVIFEIECPNCKTKITIDEALTRSLEEKMGKQLQADALQNAEKSFEPKFKLLEEQLKQKDELLRKTQDEELKLRLERNQFEEERKTFELQVQRKLDEERKKIYDDASKKIMEDHRLKDLEKDKESQELKQQIEELKRKADQNSTRIQGEVLELDLEQTLRNAFLYDQIEPIKKGEHGADILHKVCSKTGTICGRILIESKNAKNWSNQWIPKLREDQRDAQAEIAVLVTTILPEDINNFDFREGVFIIHYTMIIPVIVMLRVQLHEVTRAKNNNVNISEKKQILYDYLTGVEFRQKVESVVEAFAYMMDDLQKEKRAMNRSWTKREKQINQAITGLSNMYGGLQGIVGSSLPELKVLNLPELPEGENKEE